METIQLVNSITMQTGGVATVTVTNQNNGVLTITGQGVTTCSTKFEWISSLIAL